MLDSGKMPRLGGSTPEAECQWWADRLGDEKTRVGSAERLRENAHSFPPPEAKSVEGAFNPGGARRGLTRRRVAQPRRVYSLLVRGEAGPVVIEWAAELSCDTDLSVVALRRVTTGSRTARQAAPPPTLAGWSAPAEPVRLDGLQLSSCDTTSEGLPSC